jgi:hypothetical protein
MRSAKRPDGQSVPASYFVIHDTSSPEFENVTSFPAQINDPAWSGNRIAAPGWRDTSMRVNAIVNRAGASRTFIDYADSHPKVGMKLENCIPAAAGLFIQVENIQPRIKPRNSWGHIAPEPGFTDAQLNRLALLYVSARVRSGTWLIAAFHFNIDSQSNCGGHAHDDPQNFDLAKWSAQIDNIEAAVQSR